MYQIIKADITEWLKDYQGDPFHAMLFDPPYHLTSITERFGKEGSAPARDGVYNRGATGFMGKNWDGGDLIFQPETWQLLSTVLYPGAFVMAYCGSRGWHRQAVAMEDGGFVFHPSIFMFGMAFGSGFPKSTKIDTQIDIRAGKERETVKSYDRMGRQSGIMGKEVKITKTITKPATPLAETWQGYRYGLQLVKPAVEPLLVGQKPYEGKPVENITETGAGAINVDGGRIGTDKDDKGGWRPNSYDKDYGDNRLVYGGSIGKYVGKKNDNGRWPSNLILHHLPGCKRIGVKRVRGSKPIDRPDGFQRFNTIDYNSGKSYITGEYQSTGYADSDGYETVTEWQCVEGCPIRIIGEQSGERKSGKIEEHHNASRISIFQASGEIYGSASYGDTGTATRYFQQPDWSYEIYEQLNNADLLQYITKPSTTEREAGLEKLPFGTRNRVNSGGYEADPKFAPVERKNTHPTVKSIALNKYLATLLLPPPEYAPRRILVPFCGSGSEVIGCLLAGWDEVIGIELEQEYYDIANERVAWWYGVMESCNYDVDNIIKHWQKEQKVSETGQLRLL